MAEWMSRQAVLTAFLILLVAVSANAARPPAFPPLSSVTVKAIVVARQRSSDFFGRLVVGTINPDAEHNTAGTAKIMTALLAIECTALPTPGWCRRGTRLDSVVRVGAFRRTASLPEPLAEGDQLSLLDLLYLMMLQSWHDAARAVAEHLVDCQGQGWSTTELSGDACIRAFVDGMMNPRAYLLGMTRLKTTFRGPDGDADSTPRDLAILADHALKDPTFATIVRTPQRQVRWLTPAGKTRTLESALQHLDYPTNPSRYPGVNGVMGGSSTEAGWNLVTSATRSGKSLIVVVMGAQSRNAVYADTKKLLDYGFAFRKTR